VVAVGSENVTVLTLDTVVVAGAEAVVDAVVAANGAVDEVKPKVVTAPAVVVVVAVAEVRG